LTELLAEDINDMDKEDIQFAAVNMRSSANNLNRLLENLLEWSRMEQGLIPFNPQENILFPVVKECIATLEIAAQKKEIKIQNNIPEKTNIYADNNILHAVIRNILSNAVKFTPKGGKIVIESKENEKGTVISIEDSGIGMNAQILENLFQLDVKTNRMGTDDEPSSGLGLILCKEFIVKHGGQIWVESKENLGSTFYFNFPQAI
jgi:signal transduction histidine kinase